MVTTLSRLKSFRNAVFWVTKGMTGTHLLKSLLLTRRACQKFEISIFICGRWHLVDVYLDDYACLTKANARIMVSSTALSRHTKVISYIHCDSWSTPRCWSIEFNHPMQGKHSLSLARLLEWIGSKSLLENTNSFRRMKDGLSVK